MLWISVIDRVGLDVGIVHLGSVRPGMASVMGVRGIDAQSQLQHDADIDCALVIVLESRVLGTLPTGATVHAPLRVALLPLSVSAPVCNPLLLLLAATSTMECACSRLVWCYLLIPLRRAPWNTFSPAVPPPHLRVGVAHDSRR